ncbi:MAG: tape measure protein [Rhodocyclaceae bacterium]
MNDLVIRIRGDSAEFAAAANDAGRALEGVDARVQRTERSAQAATATLARMAGGLAALVSAGRTGAAADDWGQYASRLNIAAGSIGTAALAQERLYDASARVYKAFGASAELYIRSAESLRQIGYASADTLDMVEALSYGLTVSAADSQRSASVVDAWSKAVLLGKMGMEQYNTVVAYAPRLQQALADALGTTNAGLMQMVSNGELTADKLMLVSTQIERMGAEADQMPVTMADAATRIGNAFMRWAGQSNEALGATQLLTGGMEVLADHFDLVANGALAAAGVVGTIKVKALIDAAVAARAQATANALLARSELEAARTAQAKAAAIAAKSAVMGNAAGANAALTAANQRLAAAQTASAAAARASAGLLAMAGGPIGLLVTALGVAGAAYVTFANSAASESRRAANETQQALDDVKVAIDAIDRMGRAAYDRSVARARSQLAAAEEHVGRLQAQFDAERQRYEEAGLVGKLFLSETSGIRGADAMTTELARAREAAAGLGAQLAELEAGVDRVGTASGRAFLDAPENMTRAQREAARLAEQMKRFDEQAAQARADGQEVLARDIEARKQAWLADQEAAGKSGAAVRAVKDEFAAMMAEQAGLSKSFADDWATLTQAFEAGRLGRGAEAVERLTLAQARLLAQQPGIRAATQEQARVESARAQALGAAVDAEVRRAATLVDANERLRDEIATIGLSAEALARHRADKLAAAAAAETHAAAELEAAAALLDQAGTLPDVAREYRRLAAARREAAAALSDQAALTMQRSAADAARTAEDEWRRTAQGIEQSLTDALMRGFEDGKSFARNFRDTVRNMINTLVLRPVVQAVVQPVAGTIAGSLTGAGTGGAAGGGGSLLGSAVSSIGGVGGLVGSGLLAAGGALGAGSALGGFATGLGTALSSGAGMAGTFSAGASLAGVAGGGAAGAGMMVGAAIPAIGAVLAIAAALGAFGGKPSNKAAWGEVDLTSGELMNLGNMTGKKQASDETLNARSALLSGAAAAAVVIQQLGGDAGLSTLRVDVGERDGYQADFGNGLEQLGRDGEAAMRTIAERLIAGAYETFDSGTRAIVDELRAAGRDVIGALAWVAELDTLNRALERLGVAAFDVSVSGADAAAALAELAGGVEALAQLQGQYYEQFFSDEEKLLHLRADLSAALGDLGMEMVHSREQYRALVDGLDLMTEEGRAAYATLLSIAPEMARYIDLLDDQADAADGATTANEGYSNALREAQRSTQDSISGLQRLSSLLRGTLDQMDIGTVEAQSMRRRSAQAEISAAVAIARASDGRVLPEAEQISSALGRVAEPSQHLFGSFTDYARDFLITANDVSALAEMTDAQLSVEQQTLKWLKDRAETEDLVFSQQIAQQTIAAEALTSHTTILDSMAQSLRLISKEDQPRSAERPNTISYGAGISIDTGAEGVVMNPVTGEILWDGLSNFSRQQAEAMAAALSAMSEDEREEYLRTRSVPGFANGGGFGGGWRVVGEHGPELEYTGPSTIFNRAQAQGLIDVAAIVQELAALRDDMRAAMSSLIMKSHITARTLQQWTDEGMPEVRS